MLRPLESTHKLEHSNQKNTSISIPSFLKSPLFWDLFILVGVSTIAAFSSSTIAKISIMGSGVLIMGIITKVKKKQLEKEISLAYSIILGVKEKSWIGEAELKARNHNIGSLTIGTIPTKHDVKTVILAIGRTNYLIDLIPQIQKERNAGKNVYIKCDIGGVINCVASIAAYHFHLKQQGNIYTFENPSSDEINQIIDAIQKKFPKMAFNKNDRISIVNLVNEFFLVDEAEVDEAEAEYE